MKLIVGLGNPGPRYFRTRHNIGFEVLNALADRHFFPASRQRFGGLVTEHVLSGEKVVLLAPQTFMNASGQSVRQCVDFFKLQLEELLVIVDDMNLDVGRLRMRGSGSAGGQKGLQDVIRHLGSEAVPRLRVGIGRPPGRMDPADYVLQRFADAESESVALMVQEAVDGVELWMKSGLVTAMNSVNRPSEADGK